MKFAALSLVSLPFLAACVPAYIPCEQDYTIDYRTCNSKEGDGLVVTNFAPTPINTPSQPVDDQPPAQQPDDNGGDNPPPPADNGEETKDENGGETKDFSYEDNSSDDSNGDNSSDDSNGDNSDEKSKRDK